MKFRGQMFISHPIREKIFAAIPVLLIPGLMFWFLVEIYVRNDPSSFYELIQLSCHRCRYYRVTAFLGFMLYVVFEALLITDYGFAVMIIIADVYYCYFPLRFWLQEFRYENYQNISLHYINRYNLIHGILP